MFLADAISRWHCSSFLQSAIDIQELITPMPDPAITKTPRFDY
jgi:hypothetical protein